MQHYCNTSVYNATLLQHQCLQCNTTATPVSTMQHYCNTSVYNATLLQHQCLQCNTTATPVSTMQHYCNTSVYNATLLQHQCFIMQHQCLQSTPVFYNATLVLQCNTSQHPVLNRPHPGSSVYNATVTPSVYKATPAGVHTEGDKATPAGVHTEGDKATPAGVHTEGVMVTREHQ